MYGGNYNSLSLSSNSFNFSRDIERERERLDGREGIDRTVRRREWLGLGCPEGT